MSAGAAAPGSVSFKNILMINRLSVFRCPKLGLALSLSLPLSLHLSQRGGRGKWTTTVALTARATGVSLQ